MERLMGILQKISTFVRNANAARLKWLADRERNQALEKINDFQELYADDFPELHSEFDYTIISETDLAAMTQEQLDAQVKIVEQGFEWAEQVEIEREHKASADDPDFVFTVQRIAPRKTGEVLYNRAGRYLSPTERHCLAFHRVLFYYGKITLEEWEYACIGLLGEPTIHWSDPDADKKVLWSAAEMLDRPYLTSLLKDRRPPEFAFSQAQFFMDRALKDTPRSVRMRRLRQEYIDKKVITK